MNTILWKTAIDSTLYYIVIMEESYEYEVIICQHPLYIKRKVSKI